jgi:hypothetical protein
MEKVSGSVSRVVLELDFRRALFAPQRPGSGAIVIIMQRPHEDDLVGHVLKQEGWEIVSFPAIA